MRNIQGSSIIEENWAIKHIGRPPKKILDFGSGPKAQFAKQLAQKGFEVFCLDQRPCEIEEKIPNLTYIQGDILLIWNKIKITFDVILNISTIEHVGLEGRYNSRNVPDGDLEAMKLLGELLSDGGVHILSVPVGIDAVIAPFHRVYGENRLPKLLKNWDVKKEQYWIKDSNNEWILSSKDIALKEIPTGPERPHYYALGLFLLTKKQNA